MSRSVLLEIGSPTSARGAPCVLGAPAPMRSFVLTGRRCDLHDGQTFDTHTKFRSVNAVFSGLPQSSFLSVAQLSPFGKKLVALGNKIHHPLAFGISHRQGDQAGFRFQPAPVLGIPLSVGRIRRHGVLCPSHPGVERLSQGYVPNKGPVSGRFCEGSPASVESCRALGRQPIQGPLALLRQRPGGGGADHPSTSGQAKNKLDSSPSPGCACYGLARVRQANRTSGNCIGFRLGMARDHRARKNTSCSGAPPHVRAIPGGRGQKQGDSRRRRLRDVQLCHRRASWPVASATSHLHPSSSGLGRIQIDLR